MRRRSSRSGAAARGTAPDRHAGEGQRAGVQRQAGLPEVDARRRALGGRHRLTRGAERRRGLTPSAWIATAEPAPRRRPQRTVAGGGAMRMLTAGVGGRGRPADGDDRHARTEDRNERDDRERRRGEWAAARAAAMRAAPSAPRSSRARAKAASSCRENRRRRSRSLISLMASSPTRPRDSSATPPAPV